MECKIEDLIGQIIVNIKVNQSYLDDKIIFTTDKGVSYLMYHSYTCCENVTIEDINGCLGDLIGTPILLAEEVWNNKPSSKEDEIKYNEHTSVVWTFYKLATVKGYVTIRWFGESNGNYSEYVHFEVLNENNKHEAI